jgi:hypothetical protein
MPALPTPLCQPLEDAFQKYFTWLHKALWFGRRERELINLFAFDFLLKEIKPQSSLYDASQIAIEVDVPGLGQLNFNEQVSKDLVIWPSPRQTCWDVHGTMKYYPEAIVEWKTTTKLAAKNDIDWLQKFSVARPTAVGYCVFFNFKEPAKAEVQRFFKGEILSLKVE